MVSHFPDDKTGARGGEITYHEVTSDGKGIHTQVWLILNYFQSQQHATARCVVAIPFLPTAILGLELS